MRKVRTSNVTKLEAWLVAVRPKTLPAALAPVVVGTALAVNQGGHDWLAALVAALSALLLQIGSNFANDYFDFVKGSDTAERTGPTRAAAAGLLTLTELRRGTALVFILASLLGTYLIVRGGWPILAVGIASILAAILYTGGPLPFGYHGLGDLFVFLFFGLVAVCGTYYVQTLTLSWAAVAAAVPVGSLITAILVVNNLRDIKTDASVGKRTLAVMLGRTGTRIEYIVLVFVAFFGTVVLWQVFDYRWPILLPWLTSIMALRLAHTVVTSSDGGTLNRTLAATARLSLLFSFLLAFGLLADSLL